MKILHIVPGFGGSFYCGNCLRDSVFTRTLREMGHDAVVLPVYLPLTKESLHQKSEVPVFYGAVSIYIKQKLPFLRNMPDWLEKWFNAPRLLSFAASKSGSTRAAGLESMTASMLRGEDGYQKKELEQLCYYIKEIQKPDVVHLSNALLLGMAGKIKNELNIPVVCSLQDEDVWVDAMRPEWQEIIWGLMAENAKDVSVFIAVSQYFANVMQPKLKLDKSKLHIVPIGVNPDQYSFHEPQMENKGIGYLSRICEENGFGVLIDAFILLQQKDNMHQITLHVTGGKTDDDDKFIQEQMKKLRKHALEDRIFFYDEFSSKNLSSFFSRISLLSVPVLRGEAFGLYLLESLASGIPIVQPSLGAFPELIEGTGGGMVYGSNQAENLSAAWFQLFSNPDALIEMGIKGHTALQKKYNIKNISESMLQIYQSVSL